jgi:hypothetical protein
MAVGDITSTTVVLQFRNCDSLIVNVKEPPDDSEFAIEAVRFANEVNKHTIDAVLAGFARVEQRLRAASHCLITAYGRAGRIVELRSNTPGASRIGCPRGFGAWLWRREHY